MPIQEFSDNRDVGNLALPQTGQVDYWDRLLPSFGVRVSSGGNKSFVVSTRVNGKFRRFTIKPPFPSIGLAEARAQAVQIIADAQVGVTPEVRKKREEKGTFGAVAGLRPQSPHAQRDAA